MGTGRCFGRHVQDGQASCFPWTSSSATFVAFKPAARGHRSNRVQGRGKASSFISSLPSLQIKSRSSPIPLLSSPLLSSPPDHWHSLSACSLQISAGEWGDSHHHRQPLASRCQCINMETAHHWHDSGGIHSYTLFLSRTVTPGPFKFRYLTGVVDADDACRLIRRGADSDSHFEHVSALHSSSV